MMFVLELLLLSWLGVLAYRYGLGGWALVLPLAVALVWRALFLALNFLLSGAASRNTGTRPRMRMRAVLGEALHQARLYPFAQMIGHEWGPERQRVASGGPVIVLVHGFLCNAGLWRGMREKLASNGFTRSYALTLDPMYWRIERSLFTLETKLAAILKQEQASSVVLIGHSMGGLLARMYARKAPEQVRRVVSIGSPHHGTHGALLLGGGERGPPTANAQWLDRFNREAGSEPTLVNIWSANDNIVWPQRSAHLSHVPDYRIEGYGHLHMLDAPEVLHILIPILEQARDS